MKLSRCVTLPESTHIVLVAGLEAMLREAQNVPRLISRMLARGQRQELDPSGLHGQLLFGQELAPAALTRFLDCPEDASGLWMRADPVGLTPDLGAVWVNDRAQMDPDSTAAAELIALFADEGLELDFPVAERGYLRLSARPDCRFVPPWRLAGKSMDLVWPTGNDARRWRRLLNECQMILHQFSPAASESPGSLWFWGAGQLPATVPAARVNRVKASHPQLQAAATWGGVAWVADHCADESLAGLLMEWQVDHAQSADDNLTALAAHLADAWRQLRFKRGFKRLELASEISLWRFSPRNTWRLL